MSELTRLEHNSAQVIDRDHGVSDGPVVLSRHEGEYVAKVGLELDGFNAGRHKETLESVIADREDESDVLHALLHRLGRNQEISFVYSWNGSNPSSPFTWEVVGTSRGDVGAEVLQRTEDLAHSVQFSLGDADSGAYSWTPTHGTNSRAARHTHRYSVRPDWLHVPAAESRTVGFVGQSNPQGGVLLPRSSRNSGSRLDSIVRVGKAGFDNISLTVTVSAVDLSSEEKGVVASALQQLSKFRLGTESLKSSGDHAILDEELVNLSISRLEHWLHYPRGSKVHCEISANRSIPIAMLTSIGGQVFPSTPLHIEPAGEDRLTNVARISALDLSDCVHESDSPVPLLPKHECLKDIGIRRTYPSFVQALPDDGLLIGHGGKSDQNRRVRISESDRDRHSYVLGGTGTGKSTLLLNMIAQDIERGEGLCLIDPHGDLYEQVLRIIPEHRVKDVVALDLGNPDYSVGLNFLECRSDHPDLEANFIVNEMMAIFDRLYDLDRVGGPMFELYARGSIESLLGIENCTVTLLDVIRFFENTRFRRKVLKNTKNKLAASFFTDQASKVTGEISLANIAPYIVSKLNRFCHSARVRGIIGQAESSIDFRTCMDQGQVVLINLAKGSLGELDARLLGMILIGKILNAALSRSSASGSERKPWRLVVDEFQNLATPTAIALLSECRKYNLSFCGASQTLSQLADEQKARGLVQAILGNVGTLLAFRTGPEDAQTVSSFTSPHLNAEDLQSLPNYHAVCRMTSGNCPVPPFVLQTCPEPVPPGDRASQLKIRQRIEKNARELYMRPRHAVDSEIMRHWGSNELHFTPRRGDGQLELFPPNSWHRG